MRQMYPRPANSPGFALRVRVFSLFSRPPGKDLKSPVFFKIQIKSEKKVNFYFVPALLFSFTKIGCPVNFFAVSDDQTTASSSISLLG